MIDKSKTLYASMGVLPQSYLNSILPEHRLYSSTAVLSAIQPCCSYKANYLTPTEDSSSPLLFYFLGLCTAEVIEGTDDFKYYTLVSL